MDDEEEKTRVNHRGAVTNELRKPRREDTACMYDDESGLVSYYLFEDRLQTAINYESHKDVRVKRDKIVVLGINVENLNLFDSPESIIREIAVRMKIYLPSNYTLARGIRYTFWLMMPRLNTGEEIDLELARVRTIFRTPLKNNERLVTSMGASIYDGEDTKAKSLVEKAIIALQRAQSQGENNLMFYSGN
ncbi:MAG: diguanylate cyclase [Rhodospirillales bacterium]|nr:diguanylate cyclase [Rhodospirillales bacterium]